MKQLVSNIYTRFVLVGTTGAIINLFIFYILFNVAKFHYLFSSMVAVALSLVVSFILQKFFTFKNIDIEALSFQISNYASVAVFNMVVNSIIIFLMVEWLNLYEILAQGIAAATVAVSSFVFYRFFIFVKVPMNKQIIFNHLGFLVSVSLLAAGLVFMVNGIYDTRIDASIYIRQIESFSQGEVFNSEPGVLLRLFKPLYGFIGAVLSNLLSPVQVILAMNLTFFIILITSFFWFLLLLGFTRRYALIGSMWLVFSYPLLKYGLALGTDISGWATASLSSALVLSAVKTHKDYRLLTASLVTTIGVLSKETAVVGMLFGIMIVLCLTKKEGFRKTVKRLFLLLTPVTIIFGSYLLLIAGRAPSFFDWYRVNTKTYIDGYYTLTKFILVEGAAFNVLWILVGLVLILYYQRFKKGFLYPLMFWQYMLAMFIATLPVLAWPIFISRILFIQVLWILPVALLGLSEIEKFTLNKDYKVSFWALASLPVIVSSMLFIISQGESLFDFFF